VLEHPGPDHGVVAGQGPGDVLHRFAHVESDLVGPDGERMTAELDDRHLHGVAGTGRGLLEQQGHTETAQDLGNGTVRQVEDGAQLRG